MSGGPKLLHQQHLFSVVTHVGAAEDFSGELLDTFMAEPYKGCACECLLGSALIHPSHYLGPCYSSICSTAL